MTNETTLNEHTELDSAYIYDELGSPSTKYTFIIPQNLIDTCDDYMSSNS